MTRTVLYVAHPVAPSEEEIAEIPYETIERAHGEYERDIRHPIAHEVRVKAALKANLERAMRWLSWLRRSFPETTFIAPWISSIMAEADDSDPKQREAGLVDCCAVVERCDGIVLCGGRIASGMRRETEHGQMRHKIWIDPADQGADFATYDLTCTANPEPPLTSGPLHNTLGELAETAKRYWR